MKFSSTTQTAKASAGCPAEAALLRGRGASQPRLGEDRGPEDQPRSPNPHLLTIAASLGRSAARAVFAAAIAGMCEAGERVS